MTGLGKRLRELFQSRQLDGKFYEELEDALIEADIGVRFASETIEALREHARKNGVATQDNLREALKGLLRAHIISKEITLVPDSLNVLLVLGVNGVGKTTTIAKLARHFQKARGVERILLVAGDTFRAAAIDQLKIHGDRLGFPVVAQEPGADPGAVIFDGISSATAHGIPLVIADTAGRLHTRESLVKELGKIDKIVRSRVPGPGYQKILVVDATTGQNSLAQAEVFHKAVGLDSIVLTKLDSTAKGGMVLPICRELGLPVSFIGDGEKLDDLHPFDPDDYVSSLVGES